MKKITLLVASLMVGVTMSAQTSMTGPGADGTVINTNINRGGGAIVVTYNNSQTIEPGSEIACAANDQSSFRDNNMFTEFKLADDFGITDDFVVTSVETAIGPVTTPSGFPMTFRIWSNTGADFPDGTLTLLGEATTTVTDADFETIISVPLDATVPGGENMVLEVEIIDDLTVTNFMRFGANFDGPSGSNWIQAAACGADVPANFSDLGLDQTLIMNVVSEETAGLDDNALSQVSFFPNPASDVLNVRRPAGLEINSVVIYDVLGKATNAQIVNGQINVSSLSRGVYIISMETSAGTLTEKIVKQ